jgi:PAS domain S-box-containing protein
LLADLAGRLSGLEDAQAVQVEALAESLRFFDCGSGGVLLLANGGQPARLSPAAGKAGGVPPNEILDLPRVRTAVIKSRAALVLEEGALPAGHAFGGWGQVAVVPLAAQDRAVGLLVLGERRGGLRFDDADAALLTALGHMAGAALDTHVSFARFSQDLSRRMTEAMAELARASGELANLKTFTEDLFQSAPVGILVFDREFQVTFRNAAAARLWPEDESLLAAARRTDLVKRDAGWEAALRNVLDMQQPWRSEQVAFERRGREPVRVTLSCSPLFSRRREAIGGVLIVEDVTQRLQMEQRVAVSERLAGVGRLASMVAHEINNPLDGILRLVNLARRAGAEAGDDRIEKYLAEAHKGLMRLANIVRELLAFSRSASGSAEPMPIRDMLVEASEAASAAAERPAVAVRVDGAPDLPPLKSSILFHVVLNLVKNAIEAIEGPGEVHVTARCRDSALVIEVTDTGPGIAEERLPHLFEPFYTRKTGGRGTGLGLVISRDLVEKQGGTIAASNRPEGGARFTITIPLAPSAADRAGA